MENSENHAGVLGPWMVWLPCWSNKSICLTRSGVQSHLGAVVEASNSESLFWSCWIVTFSWMFQPAHAPELQVPQLHPVEAQRHNSLFLYHCEHVLIRENIFYNTWTTLCCNHICWKLLLQTFMDLWKFYLLWLWPFYWNFLICLP